MQEEIILVNSQDKIIGTKPRNEVKASDIYRVSVLCIYDQAGRILLGRRAATKKNDPDKWTTLVNGTNAKGETYESNIIKEAEEEIGIIVTNPVKIAHRRITEKHNFFVTFFNATVPSTTKFQIDTNEISETKWFSQAELRQAITSNPGEFVPGFASSIFPILF